MKGGGVAALDYDDDGWVDLAFSRGSSLERWRAGTNPGPSSTATGGTARFEDVTQKAGLTRGGWGVGVSAADYDNDGRVDLYLTNLGPDVLYRNNGDGTFTDVTEKAGIRAPGWSSSAAFGDFDRDGFLDLYVAGYLDVGPDKLPEGRGGGTCAYVGVPVLCGPRGLPGSRRPLLPQQRGRHLHASGPRPRGPSTRSATSASASWPPTSTATATSTSTSPTTRRRTTSSSTGATARFDERGFPSGVAVSGDGNEQASMGVDAADYDNDGRLDLYSAHFASDYSTLYHNLGGLLFEDVTARARIREPGLGLREVGHRLRRPRSRRLEGHRARERARLPAPARRRPDGRPTSSRRSAST